MARSAALWLFVSLGSIGCTAAPDMIDARDGSAPDAQPNDVAAPDAFLIARGDSNVPDASVDGSSDVCAPGTARPCFVGAAIETCRTGMQTCQVSGEFGRWGECIPDERTFTCGLGACERSVAKCTDGSPEQCTPGMPGREECGNGIDDDCNGRVDDVTGTIVCGIGACQRTVPMCPGGVPGNCVEGAPTMEICGNEIDEDCDGEDLPCVACFPGVDRRSRWQIHLGEGPVCFGGTTFTVHGDRREYDWSSIPAATDAGWQNHTPPNISFDDPSTLCGTSCDCLDGGDFTYFQTSFTVPNGLTVSSLEVNIVDVDDGVRVTLFNSAYPSGVSPRDAYAFHPTGRASNLGSYVRSGTNRIVLTHVDDCCRYRRIRDATVILNGTTLGDC